MNKLVCRLSSKSDATESMTNEFISRIFETMMFRQATKISFYEIIVAVVVHFSQLLYFEALREKNIILFVFD